MNIATAKTKQLCTCRFEEVRVGRPSHREPPLSGKRCVESSPYREKYDKFFQDEKFVREQYLIAEK